MWWMKHWDLDRGSLESDRGMGSICNWTNLEAKVSTLAFRHARRQASTKLLVLPESRSRIPPRYSTPGFHNSSMPGALFVQRRRLPKHTRWQSNNRAWTIIKLKLKVKDRIWSLIPRPSKRRSIYCQVAWLDEGERRIGLCHDWSRDCLGQSSVTLAIPVTASNLTAEAKLRNSNANGTIK